MRVSTKMTMIVGTMIIGLAAIGISTTYMTNRLFNRANDANINVVPSILLLDEIRHDFLTIRGRLNRHVLTLDMPSKARIEQDLASSETQLIAELNSYLNDGCFGTPCVINDEDIRLNRLAFSKFEDYRKQVPAIIEESRKGASGLENARALIDALSPLGDEISDVISDHMEFNRDLAAQISRDAEIVRSETIGFQAVIIACTSLLLISMVALFARRLFHQLGEDPDELIKTTEALAIGETHAATLEKDPVPNSVLEKIIKVGQKNIHLHEELKRIAVTDPVFDIPNLIGMNAYLQTLDRAGVAIVRLEDLPTIYSAFGVEQSQAFTKATIKRLRKYFPEHNQVSRIQVDSLGVVFKEGQDLGLLMKALKESDEGLPPIRTTIGFANQPDAAVKNLQYAIMALLDARPDTGPQTFTPALPARIAKRVTILNELAPAIGTDQIKVFMQPQVRLEDRKIVSAEALVRWQKSDGNFVMPGDFIELAENSGDIILLGRQVADLAISAKSHWTTSGQDVKVSINTSPRELATPGTAKGLADLAEKYGVDPGTITVEITETAFASDDSIVSREIELLSGLGFRLAIDDFGTGHSSLMRLTNLNVSEVKLDRSLCLKIDRDPRSVGMAKLVRDLGLDLNFDVLAEGIETEEQYKILRDIGIPYGQGYLFGRPMPVADFLRLSN